MRWYRSFIVAFAVLLVSAAAQAQQVGGSALQGRVVDQQQAVLPGVNIIITNQDNGTFRETVTGPDGTYFATGLQAGRYKVAAELSGIQEVQPRGRHAHAGKYPDGGDQARGRRAQETVTVTAEAAPVDLTSSQGRRQRRIEGGAGTAVADAQLHRVRRDGARRPAQSQRGGIGLAQHQRPEQQPGHLRARRRQQHGRQLRIGLGGTGANAAGGGRRIPGPDQPVRRGIRTNDRRGRERDHQTRHECVPRIGVRLSHELRHDGGNHLREAVRRRRGGHRQTPVRRHLRWSDDQEQDSFLRQLRALCARHGSDQCVSDTAGSQLEPQERSERQKLHRPHRPSDQREQHVHRSAT